MDHNFSAIVQGWLFAEIGHYIERNHRINSRNGRYNIMIQHTNLIILAISSH